MGKIVGFMPTYEFHRFPALAKESKPFVQLVYLRDDSLVVLSNVHVSEELKCNTVDCYDPERASRMGQKLRMATNYIEDRAARLLHTSESVMHI